MNVVSCLILIRSIVDHVTTAYEALIANALDSIARPQNSETSITW